MTSKRLGVAAKNKLKLHKFVKKGKGRVLNLEYLSKNKKLIGYAESYEGRWSNVMRVTNVAVEMKHRGKGISTDLMHKLFNYSYRKKAVGDVISPIQINVRKKFPTVIKNGLMRSVMAISHTKVKKISTVSKDGKRSVRFVRRNGRVIPIKVKK